MDLLYVKYSSVNNIEYHKISFTHTTKINSTGNFIEHSWSKTYYQRQQNQAYFLQLKQEINKGILEVQVLC